MLPDRAILIRGRTIKVAVPDPRPSKKLETEEPSRFLSIEASCSTPEGM
jgi:hypothetical protein